MVIVMAILNFLWKRHTGKKGSKHLVKNTNLGGDVRDLSTKFLKKIRIKLYTTNLERH